MLKHPFLDILFLICLVSMWGILLYHSYLIVMAYQFFIRGKKRLDRQLNDLKYFPHISILIPAHNEEVVMNRTLSAMLQLEYPSDRLEVIVIDDNSTDKTREIVDRFARVFRRISALYIPEGEGGKGKAHALNYALPSAKGEVICVYDADNSPEPDALKYLIAELVSNEELAAVCGKVRTQNRRKNLLTRFINLEFIFHQWVAQAGQWYSRQIAMIPGTNFVVRKQVLEKIGGWDENALTEDMELTLRILDLGLLISFNPFAITWEQEPETWPVWFRQRLRWLKGNHYIIKKHYLKILTGVKNIRHIYHILYMIAIYGILFLGIVVSDILFLLGILNLTHVTIAGPLLLTWFLAFLLFVVGISVTLSFEETSENTLANVATTVLMYFTYCQLWIILGLRSWFSPLKNQTEKNFWAKTPRVKLESP